MTNVDQLVSAAIRLKRDDGAAVYLNGVEVIRSNLASAAAFDGWATESAVSDGNVLVEQQIPAGLLREGQNLLAVEVHQADAGSSDVSFDLELVVARASGVADVPLKPGINRVLVQDWISFVSDDSNRFKIARLRTPALMLEPEADYIPEHSEQNLSCFPKTTQYRLIRRAGHFPWLEQQSIVRTLLRRFIKQQVVGRSRN